jgi:signal transduction histidine kinase
MQLWTVGAVANIVILIAYAMISYTIGRGLISSRQRPSDNPLAWATAAIFLTCAVHHGAHPVHMLLPAFGAGDHLGHAAREMFQSWPLTLWDILTAAVAVWYLSLRARFPALVRGAAIFEDMRERQRQALDIHDNVVQGLATAKLHFELDQRDDGLAAVEATLAASRTIITDLLGDEDSETGLGPGDFRRQAPASRTGSERSG